MRTPLIVSLAACAHHAAPPAAAPDYRPVTAEPAPPQGALYGDCLADAVAKLHSEFTAGARVFRSTQRVRQNLFGVDYCSAEQCVISLNAGDFVR